MKDVKGDLIVIGAGPSGLAAAITAAENGSRVIVFEKLAHTGGAALQASHVFGVESKLQKLKQVSLTREQAFKIWMDFNHWSVDASLVKAFINKSASTIDWLEKMGTEFWDLTCHGRGNYFTGHIVKAKAPLSGSLGAASYMMANMAARAKVLGIQIFIKAQVKQILKENGIVTGVTAETRDGEKIQARAKAVVIGTGGLGGILGPILPNLKGDGFRMAREVGADVAEGTMVRYKKGTIPESSVVTAYWLFLYPHLIVNQLGERFCDEEITITTPYMVKVLAKQKNRCAFTIFDENTKNYFVENGMEYPGLFGVPQFGEPMWEVKDFDSQMKQNVKRWPEDYYIAGSLKELASQTGINLDGLTKTLEEYNEACKTGRDDAFNKNARYLRPVNEPKFYAYKTTPFASGTPEGIKISRRFEVLTEDFDVIPGLYAAGTDVAGSIHGDCYPNVLPANNLGWALNSGRLAGENAFKYIKK
jgi:fumarate reductase flavoprotein subunit